MSDKQFRTVKIILLGLLEEGSTSVTIVVNKEQFDFLVNLEHKLDEAAAKEEGIVPRMYIEGVA